MLDKRSSSVPEMTRDIDFPYISVLCPHNDIAFSYTAAYDWLYREAKYPYPSGTIAKSMGFPSVAYV